MLASPKRHHTNKTWDYPHTSTIYQPGIIHTPTTSTRMKISNQLPSTPASPTDAEVVAVWAAEAVLPPNQLSAVLASTVTTGGGGKCRCFHQTFAPVESSQPGCFSGGGRCHSAHLPANLQRFGNGNGYEGGHQYRSSSSGSANNVSTL